MFNMEKRYRNKIIIIIINFCLWLWSVCVVENHIHIFYRMKKCLSHASIKTAQHQLSNTIMHVKTACALHFVQDYSIKL